MEFLGPEFAQISIAPMVIAAIISAVGSMAAAEKAKKGQQSAASGAGLEGGAAPGIEMKAAELPLADAGKKNQSYVSDGSEITKAALGAGPSIGTVPQGGLPVGGPSKINAEILGADGQAPPVIVPGSTGDMGAIPGQQSQTDISTSLPESTEIDTSGTDPSKMSMEAKMAMAAQIGSLMRGNGAPPPPGNVSGGGPGINMQPVFLKDLR